MTQQAQHGRASLAPCFYNFNRCDRRAWHGVHAKQIYHCMMAGIELENYAIGHEMSNQQSEKPSIPDTADLDPLGLGHK